MERLIDIAAKRLKIDRRGAAPPQSDPPRQAAPSHGDRAHLRQRGFCRQSRPRARSRGLGRLSRPAARRRRSAAGCSGSASPITSRRRSACRTSASPSRCGRQAASSSWSARSRAGRGTRRAFGRSSPIGSASSPRRSISRAATARCCASGGGTHSDRSMRLAGSLMVETSRTVIDKARRDRRRHARALPKAIFRSRTDCSWRRTAIGASPCSISPAPSTGLPRLPDDLRGPLAAEATFTGRIPAYPTGAAVCEVEVDPETGAVEFAAIPRSTTAASRSIRSFCTARCTAAWRRAWARRCWRRRSTSAGRASFCPQAFSTTACRAPITFPHLEVELTEDPTKGNALRVKGGGEAGITPSSAALDECGHGRALRPRHRAHGHAGDAAARLAAIRAARNGSAKTGKR